MMKRAAVLLSVATVLAGTVAAAPGAQGPAAAAGAGKGVVWQKCATPRYPTLQCASVAVPLDHDRPAGRRISLALTRVPHTAKKSQGPLLVNPGGPGGSGRALAGFIASALPREVAAQYDVIGFDPRGVGRSEPTLDCATGHFEAVRPDSVPHSADDERANLRRAQGFAQGCAAKHGDVLPFIDTVSAAKDLDVVRAALGAPRINYLGYSYGTYLGAVYARLFPQRVRRLVLDSMVDPTGVWYQANLAQDSAFDARHKAFLAWVARHDDRYGLGSDPQEVEDAWYRMRNDLRHAPAGGEVGPSELEDTFLPGGYYNGYWPHLAEAFAAYWRGESKPLVEAYRKFGAVDPAAGNSYSVYTAVQCRDSAWPREWSRWRADMWDTHAKAPFMTWNNAWYNAPCAFWSVPAQTPPDVANEQLPPALLFQATEDAATPYEGALEMHRKLAGSSLVVESGGGNHGIALSGNSCLDAHLVRYLTDGRVPRSAQGPVDASCPAQPEPTPTPATRAVVGANVGGATLHGLLGFRP
ncbi:alpha/beta hydrolase [Streptomyces sp. NPDC006879]|uniref:alpha/beta hydrolase n=1 Tax=Streptomyces sp. NPDC006879 TaxID=3364767 RepID=UPI0036BE7B2E